MVRLLGVPAAAMSERVRLLCCLYSTQMDYKAVKEAFHADNPGSSVHYINALSVTALVRCR